MTKSREERARALEKWADTIDASDLRTADTRHLRRIAELVDQRSEVDEQITDAVASARRERRSWSEIGLMLGVSKQAAQRKYASMSSAESHPAGLTQRQLEVLELVAEGLTTGEIADRLFLSRRTVEHHVSALLAKLGVSARQQAVKVAEEKGLLST